MKDKKIILGITGSIAVYKAALLVRLLVKEGADVKVVMTSMAAEFVSPLTFSTLSEKPVLTDFFDRANGKWESHVDLGLWGDLMLIAPATANSIAKMASGIADNFLLTTYLSTKCPVFISPAMDLDMYKHPSTIRNLETLKSNNNIIIEPGTGELASGLSGKGRMEEPENIVKVLKKHFETQSDFSGKNVMITAGPTYEAIDPVRFIANHSTGKMGYAIAEEFEKRGAKVTLISGPTTLNTNLANIEIIKVTSAQEMYDACLQVFVKSDIAVMSAAVADYTPDIVSDSKVKSDKNNLTLKLKPTKDIAASIGKIKKNNQIIAGFALETNNEIENAKQKIVKKNLDLIVLNSLKDSNAGFGYDTNKITIIDKNNSLEQYDLKTKKDVAKDIANKIQQIIADQQT